MILINPISFFFIIIDFYDLQLKEFRVKVGNVLPRIPKNENQGRSEFSGLNDLFQYLIDEDEKQKKLKAAESLPK